MKKLGVISSLTLSAVLAIAAIPAGAQTTAGTTNASVPVADPAPLSTPAPASVTNNLNLIPSLAPTPAAAPAAASSSSDSFHRFDFFAGYSFLSNEIATVDDGQFNQLLHGYAASVTFNLNKNFGILADFSGNNGTALISRAVSLAAARLAQSRGPALRCRDHSMPAAGRG